VAKKIILFFHHSDLIGGAGISGLNVLKAIPKDNFDIIVFCKSNGGQMPEKFRENGFKVIEDRKAPTFYRHCVGSECGFFSISHLTNIINIIRNFKMINKVIDEVNPNIVIVNSMTLFWIGKIAKRKNKKTICFFRETYIKGAIGIRTANIKKSLSKYFDKVAFISKYDCDNNKSIHSKKYVIYNMVDSKPFLIKNESEINTELNIERNYFNILYLGGLNKLKGAHVILEAISKVKNQNVRLIFVGYQWNGQPKKVSIKRVITKLRCILNIDYEKKFIDFIIDNDLKSKIKFYPSQKDIAPFYSLCNAIVFPATKPHQARPIFEAGLAKIPVIVTKFDNLKEFINDNNGYLFENNNSDNLASIIDTISLYPDDFKNKVENNFNLTKSRHSETVFKTHIENLLK
jgi:glycosyltransferase involved in cell wall biosynthesis